MTPKYSGEENHLSILATNAGQTLQCKFTPKQWPFRRRIDCEWKKNLAPRSQTIAILAVNKMTIFGRESK